MSGDVGRCGEMERRAGLCLRGDMGRCGEMWGDVGRSSAARGCACGAPRRPNVVQDTRAADYGRLLLRLLQDMARVRL